MDDLWIQTLLLLDSRGVSLNSRNGSSSEVIGYSAKLADVSQNFLFNKIRKLSPYYACAELLWYLSMTDNTSFLQLFAPGYAKFCEDGVHAFGAYGHRWKINGYKEYDQLTEVIDVLQKHPESRQAIMTMWEASDLGHARHLDKKDLPCTLTHQFLLREGYLHLVTTMRSNDVWLGMPYDVFCNTQLQKLIADILGVMPGSYTHNVGSMHYYEKNFEDIDSILNTSKKGLSVDSPAGVHYSSIATANLTEQISSSVEFVWKCMHDAGESSAESLLSSESDMFLQQYTIITDAALVCAAKWNEQFIEHITDPQLRRAVEVFNG